ncbi:hypothetical protein Zmor_016341 [Zophobas morio]|uniref:Uncharacterized protein n=1 Tax=Zophobas morio TaxID=2755281 RepID=A0AA38HI35_9CUCU|nr:hypothetical protein Zmor_016341 [Zophobas morio]
MGVLFFEHCSVSCIGLNSFAKPNSIPLVASARDLAFQAWSYQVHPSMYIPKIQEQFPRETWTGLLESNSRGAWASGAYNSKEGRGLKKEGT